MVPAHPLRRVLDVLTIVVFAAALSSSRLDELLRDDALRGPDPEGRTAWPYPSRPTTLSGLNQFSSRFEAYYFDTFGLRDVLLRWNTIVDYFGLGLAPSSDLVVGRDDWIFFAGERTFENLRGVVPLSDDALEGWRAALESRRDVLADAGCAYMFVACPNKETIYGERVPGVHEPLGPTRLDQIASYLARTSSVEFLDLRATILAEKAADSGEDTLYPAHGTHWMGRAAFAAYRAITLSLSRRFPTMNRYDIAECHFPFEMTTEDSWAPKMYLGTRLLHRIVRAAPIAGPRYVPLRREQEGHTWKDTDVIGDPDGPRAIVFCDSFFEAVHTLLSDSFAEVMYVRGAPISEQQITDFHPDVVIDLFVERRFFLPPPLHLAGLPPARGDAFAFDEAQTSLFALDWKQTTGGLISTGSARSSKVGAGADTSISLSTPSGGDDVRLPTIIVPEASDVFLRITASCTADQLMYVYWKPKDALGFKIAWRVQIPLTSTVRSSTLQISVPAGPLDVMLRTQSTAILREFELRAAPR